MDSIVFVNVVEIVKRNKSKECDKYGIVYMSKMRQDDELI